MSDVKNNLHCGIIVSYKCNAACRHCMFACSPERSSDYLSPETAERICVLLRGKGIRSLHISGGEPFLDFDKMVDVIKVIRKTGISIEYVETNAFWAEDERRVKEYLRILEQAGADRLLISLDPFHAEYVPIGLPLRLVEICENVNFKYILWKREFKTMLADVNQNKIHSRIELEQLISPQYILETAKMYGLDKAGRAFNILNEYTTLKPVNEIVAKSHSCRNLLKVGALHVDLYERYLVTGCPDISLPLIEAIEGIPKGRYSVFEALSSNGAAGLLKYAQGLGFEPDTEYSSSCALCFNIRLWLSENHNCPELDPVHHKAVLSHYC